MEALGKIITGIADFVMSIVKFFQDLVKSIHDATDNKGTTETTADTTTTAPGEVG